MGAGGGAPPNHWGGGGGGGGCVLGFGDCCRGLGMNRDVGGCRRASAKELRISMSLCGISEVRGVPYWGLGFCKGHPTI